MAVNRQSSCRPSRSDDRRDQATGAPSRALSRTTSIVARTIGGGSRPVSIASTRPLAARRPVSTIGVAIVVETRIRDCSERDPVEPDDRDVVRHRDARDLEVVDERQGQRVVVAEHGLWEVLAEDDLADGTRRAPRFPGHGEGPQWPHAGLAKRTRRRPQSQDLRWPAARADVRHVAIPLVEQVAHRLGYRPDVIEADGAVRRDPATRQDAAIFRVHEHEGLRTREPLGFVCVEDPGGDRDAFRPVLDEEPDRSLLGRSAT